MFPFIEKLFADSAYDHHRVRNATSINVETVRKIADQVGFVVLPGRWVVEHFFAWINRNRHLAKDVETTINSARAFLHAASIMLLVRPQRQIKLTYRTDSEMANGTTSASFAPVRRRRTPP